MKRKYTTAVIFIFLIRVHIYGQGINIDYEKAYNFLNSAIITDTIQFNLSNSMDFWYGDDTASILADSIFDDGDRDYFRYQLEMSGKIKWEKDKINQATIISEGEIRKVFHGKNGWDKFRNKYGKCLTNFSLPIFDKEFNYCIFYQWTQCDYLAGGGSIDLYKFVNGKWVFVKFYMMGIS